MVTAWQRSWCCACSAKQQLPPLPALLAHHVAKYTRHAQTTHGGPCLHRQYASHVACMSYRPVPVTPWAWRRAISPAFLANTLLRPGTHTRASGTMVSTCRTLYKHVRVVSWLTWSPRHRHWRAVAQEGWRSQRQARFRDHTAATVLSVPHHHTHTMQ